MVISAYILRKNNTLNYNLHSEVWFYGNVFNRSHQDTLFESEKSTPQ